MYRLKDSLAQCLLLARTRPILTISRLFEASIDSEIGQGSSMTLKNRLYRIPALPGVVLLLSLGSVQALELGPINVESHLNQPLKAFFTLQKAGETVIEDIHVSLADHMTYRSFGLPRTSFLNQLKFTLLEGQNGQHRVRVSTRERIMEPILEVLVRVTQKQNSLTRLYTLMVDPVDVSNLLRNSTPTPEQPEIDKPVANENRITLDKSKVDRIEVKNKSISLIAQDSVLHEKYSVYQIMRAFYLQNPQAFNKGNINFIQSGSLLIVPDESTVAEVPRREAIKFVKSASKNYPFKRSQKQNRKLTVENKPAIVKPKPSLRVEGELIDDEMTPAVLYEEIKISPAVEQDLTTWRSMTEEFKSLNNLLQSHNRAIQLQNEVMQEMEARMDKKNEDIMQLVLRIGALESSLQSFNPGMVSDVEGVQNVLINQNRVIKEQQQAITEINDELKRKDKYLSRMDERLQSIEKQDVSISSGSINAQQNIITDESQELVVKNSVDSGSTVSSLVKFNKIWVLAGLAIVIFLGVAWKLTRRRSGSEVIVKKSFRTRPKHKLETAQTKFESTLTAEVIEQKQSRSKINTDSIGDVHTELDILIAYEQFDEALQLVHKAKKKLKDDRWLDIKEIEILACTKNYDLFYSRMEEHEETLSREFPLAWKNIMKLSRKLNQEFQKSAIS